MSPAARLQVQPDVKADVPAILKAYKATVDVILECYALDAADEAASFTVARSRATLDSISTVSEILRKLLGDLDPLLARALSGQIYAELDAAMIAKIDEAVTGIYGEGERSPKGLADRLVALGDLARLLPGTLPVAKPGGGRAGTRFAREFGTAKAHLAAHALALFKKARPGEKATTTEDSELHQVAENLLALAEHRPLGENETSMLRHLRAICRQK